MARTAKGQAAYDAFIAHQTATNGLGADNPAVVTMANNYADDVELTERLEANFAAGGQLYTALATLLTRTAAIKAKTDLIT